MSNENLRCLLQMLKALWYNTDSYPIVGFIGKDVRGYIEVGEYRRQLWKRLRATQRASGSPQPSDEGTQ